MPITGVDSNAVLAMQQRMELLQHPTGLESAFTPQGLDASMARGNNVYMGGLPHAPGAGRPRNPTPVQGDTTSPAMQAALQQRMQQYGQDTRAREARG